MKKLILCVTVLFAFLGFAQSQILEFDILHNGKPLGTLKASKKAEGSKIIYTSHTSIAYHLLVSIDVVYDYYVEYNDSDLTEATAHIVVRGTDKTKVKTIKEGETYKYYSNGKMEKTIEPPLNHSIAQLLFEEPSVITKVYSIEHGEYQNIKRIGPHRYLKTATNGHINTYYYENGILQESEIDAGVIKFSIVRKK